MIAAITAREEAIAERFDRLGYAVATAPGGKKNYHERLYEIAMARGVGVLITRYAEPATNHIEDYNRAFFAPTTEWGNPFPVNWRSGLTREYALASFYRQLIEFPRDLEPLRGKILFCRCRGATGNCTKTTLCHGDIYCGRLYGWLPDNLTGSDESIAAAILERAREAGL
jgi:hypothetical protein